MKKLASFILIVAALAATSAARAVTYPFPNSEPSHMKSEAVIGIGSTVYMFHSGTDEVKKTINVDDILTVYRQYPSDFSLESIETGKIKVISPVGDYYIKGDVIEGEAKPGYLAKKGAVALFITSWVRNHH